MSKTYSTADCAAHVAHYLHAQPVATAQLLTLDDRIDQLKNDLLIAKAENDQATIDRLRSVWAELSAEIEAEEITTADLDADAALPFEPSVCELREMAAASLSSNNSDVSFLRQPLALPPLIVCDVCGTPKDDLGRCACDYRISLDLDCLIAAMEAQPATKPRQKAWDLLSEQSTVTVRSAGYVVPSATWSDKAYIASAQHGCTCESRKECWHIVYARICDLAREHEAIDQAAFSAAYIEACYEAFEPVYLAGIAGVATPTHTAQPTINYRAALASGISDLWA